MVPPDSDRNFTGSRPTQDTCYLHKISLTRTGLSPCLADASQRVSGSLNSQSMSQVLQPRHGRNHVGLGYFRVRSPLLCGITIVFSSSGYLDVSVPRVCFLADDWPPASRVAPFGNLRIKGRVNRSRSLSQFNTSFIASKSLGIPPCALN